MKFFSISGLISGFQYLFALVVILRTFTWACSVGGFRLQFILHYLAVLSGIDAFILRWSAVSEQRCFLQIGSKGSPFRLCLSSAVPLFSWHGEAITGKALNSSAAFPVRCWARDSIDAFIAFIKRFQSFWDWSRQSLPCCAPSSSMCFRPDLNAPAGVRSIILAPLAARPVRPKHLPWSNLAVFHLTVPHGVRGCHRQASSCKLGPLTETLSQKQNSKWSRLIRFTVPEMAF